MKRTLVMFTLVAAAGCGGSSKPVGGVGGVAGNPASGIAVLNSDFKSTVLSLVDSDATTLVKDDCLDSGAVNGSLSMALSGDVVVAATPQPNGDILLVDRMNSALTWVKPASCTVESQLSVGTGFYSNPQSVVPISASKAYVTRYEANPAGGSASANDEGNDVLIIDPSAQKIVGHVDVASYAVASTTATILARPAGATLGNGKVWVALNDISADFGALSDGVIVGIDPASDSVATSLTLTGYRDCGGLDYDDGSKTLLVSCVGDFTADAAGALASSALVLVDVSGATPSVVKAVAANSIAGNTRPLGGGVFAGGNLIVANTQGDYMGTTPDQLWTIDTSSGAASKLADGDAPGVFGGAMYVAAKKLVLVPDASATKPVVRVYDVSNAASVSVKTTIEANPKSGLPPVGVGRY